MLAAVILVATAAAAPAPRRPGVRDLARDTLAIVCDRPVTAFDLVRRIELMPWPERASEAGIDSLRIHALHSLVGERLLATAAERRALGDSSRLHEMRIALVRALARDALYRDLT